MVDYYALPQARETEHGLAAPRLPVKAVRSGRKAAWVEAALLEDLIAEMGQHFDPRRFVPFVVMHEFEGLLFSDCAAFSRGIGRPDLESDFRRIRNAFQTPEEIDDSPITAPSKRVEALLPGYEKPLLGTLAVLEIGLPRIRAECPHFDGWLKRLESVACNLR